MESLFIGTDDVGQFPNHLRDGEGPPAGNVRWRLLAEPDDFAEAAGHGPGVGLLPGLAPEAPHAAHSLRP